MNNIDQKKPPCDCTSVCGDDQDIWKGLAEPCAYRQPKNVLLGRLGTQANGMRDNADLLEKLYPELNLHQQLRGAQLITENWIKLIQEMK